MNLQNKMKDRADWRPIDKYFFKQVEKHPIVYNDIKSDDNLSYNGTLMTAAAWQAISNEMFRMGLKIKPKSCRDKFVRIRKEFEKIYKISKVDKSVLSSKYLDGSLSFLDKKIKNNDVFSALNEQTVARQEESNVSVTGIEFPAISLLSSDSDSESTVSTITDVSKAAELSNEKGKGIKMTSSIYNPCTQSAEIVSKPTETTTSKTIVSLEMIEAFLKSKTDYSEPNTVRSIFSDNASDTSANLIRTLPIFEYQMKVDKPFVAEAKDFACTSMLNTGPDCSLVMPAHTITNNQVKTNNYADIPEEVVNSNTAPNTHDVSYASPVNVSKKEKTSIFDINSEEDDIQVFLNEVADYMSNSYTIKRQTDIRLKISDLVSAAETEDKDQQCNSHSTNVITDEDFALEQLSGIKHISTQSHVYDYDLGSDSDSSI